MLAQLCLWGFKRFGSSLPSVPLPAVSYPDCLSAERLQEIVNREIVRQKEDAPKTIVAVSATQVGFACFGVVAGVCCFIWLYNATKPKPPGEFERSRPL